MSLCRSEPSGFLPRSLLPVDVERRPQHARLDERADVQAHAVVQIRLPPDRLLVQLLPPHVDVERRLTLEDRLELALQAQRGRQPSLGAGHLVAHLGALALDPVLTEIGVGQLLQRLAVEPVVVHQRREPVALAVPDVPDERPVPEQRAVLLEELVPQPVGKVLLLAPRLLQQLLDLRRRPRLAERRGEHLLQPIRRRRLTRHRRQAHDPVGVGERVEIVGLGLLRPPVPDKPRDRHLQRRRRHLRPPLEQPLRRIIRPRLRQRIRPRSATCRQRSTSNGTLTSVAVRDVQLRDRSLGRACVNSRDDRNAQSAGKISVASCGTTTAQFVSKISPV